MIVRASLPRGFPKVVAGTIRYSDLEVEVAQRGTSRLIKSIENKTMADNATEIKEHLHFDSPARFSNVRRILRNLRNILSS
jgi:hypothetical protein